MQTFSLLISIGIIALLSFIFRTWLKRFIDNIYNTKESDFIQVNQKRTELLKTQVPIIMELSQVVYKSNNLARNILINNTAIGTDKDDLIQCSSILTERLYMYSVMIDDEIFDKIHDFKRNIQNFCMYLDVSDRPEVMKEGLLYFTEELRLKLEISYININNLHDEIRAYFKNITII